MDEADADARVFLRKVTGHVLGTVDRAVLTTCAAEADHQAGESAAGIRLHMRIDNSICMLKEAEHLTGRQGLEGVEHREHESFVLGCLKVVRQIKLKNHIVLLPEEFEVVGIDHSSRVVPKSKVLRGGVGLDNVRRRLELMCAGGYQLDIDDSDTSFSVKLTMQSL